MSHTYAPTTTIHAGLATRTCRRCGVLHSTIDADQLHLEQWIRPLTQGERAEVHEKGELPDGAPPRVYRTEPPCKGAPA